MYAKEWGHPHIGHHLGTEGHIRVKTPCCGRMVRADRVYDFRMVPKTHHPSIYNKEADFHCEACINHAVLNLRKFSYQEMVTHMKAPQVHIDGARMLDEGIEANRRR